MKSSLFSRCLPYAERNLKVLLTGEKYSACISVPFEGDLEGEALSVLQRKLVDQRYEEHYLLFLFAHTSFLLGARPLVGVKMGGGAAKKSNR